MKKNWERAAPKSVAGRPFAKCPGKVSQETICSMVSDS